MASAPLLSRVSGLSNSLAEAIIVHREQNGAFKSRRDLLSVPRLGKRAFELCAGFLRIPNGAEPLDASSVHPEAYGVARKIIAACGRDIRSLMGDSAFLKTLDPARFVDAQFGVPTVRDILQELEKPGRDPRPQFKTATFAEGVDDMGALKPGMVLEGTVTNVANFGAFVDIGVHQDGLVHVSQLADRFVKDPGAIVKAGDVVTVRVVEVDLKRKRIALTMRKDRAGESLPAEVNRASPQGKGDDPRSRPAGQRSMRPESSPPQGSLGAALSEALRRK